MAKIKVFLDPGHGGLDRTNKGPTGYVEADGMLDICLRLRDLLLKNGNFEVKMSRDKDATVGVRRRGEMAAEWKADVFISNHSNATGGKNTTTTGVEVYYSVDIPNDRAMASNFSMAIAEAMNTKYRGAKTRESQNYPGEDFYGVIDAAQDGGVKHVFLIENGFHDHAQEESKLKDPNIRQKIAEAQYRVICEFYNVEGVTTTMSKHGLVVSTEELNIRPAPNTNNTPLTTIKKYTLVEIISEVDGWYEVEVDVGGKRIKGYTSKNYITQISWEQKIVAEAYNAGIITSSDWINTPKEKIEAWYVCAVAINLLKKLKEGK